MAELKLGDRVKSPYGTGTIIDLWSEDKEDKYAMVYHDAWSEGHNAGTDWDDKSYVGNHCWMFNSRRLIEEGQP